MGKSVVVDGDVEEMMYFGGLCLQAPERFSTDLTDFQQADRVALMGKAC